MFHRSTIDEETYLLLKKISALAGGTSLALQTGHRHSIDLDFFATSSFNTRDIEILLSAEPSINFVPVDRTERMLFCYINKVKCDFIYEPVRMLYPFIEDDGIRYFHIKDIAAMKMHTICGRGKRKDFFDVYVLIELFGWQQMLNWFGKKYGDSQFYYLWRSITYFDDADEDVPVTGFTPYTKNWEQIKIFILENCT
jgi:predicted nucleotidyltransferase component of viral defense system